ncbi:hypothetical protein [Pelagibaculum spongiae]|uniref:Uncharacterized protein n=1 Tax=Pelagibaculum spongiae TaxID=2080658 RepID=A0A2V1GT68_9GAMM|nr:hypothetical protein [Pelagibaculum spongiae]PVZ68865.1 hypothetical protein DC094_11465 [Pelagibaculum spongiae]
MYKVLFLAFFIISCSEAVKQPLSIVKAHQESLNKKDLLTALEYWQPSKREKLAGQSFNVIASMFSGLKLDPSSIKQNCTETECTVTGVAEKAGKLLNINYTFVKIEGELYISNIQSKDT